VLIAHRGWEKGGFEEDFYDLGLSRLLNVTMIALRTGEHWAGANTVLIGVSIVFNLRCL
jgi:hypothetical protein